MWAMASHFHCLLLGSAHKMNKIHTHTLWHFVNHKTSTNIMATTLCNNAPSYLRVANQMAKHAWKLKIMYKMHSAANNNGKPKAAAAATIVECVSVCVSHLFVCVCVLPRLGFVNAMKCDSCNCVCECECMGTTFGSNSSNTRHATSYCKFGRKYFCVARISAM